MRAQLTDNKICVSKFSMLGKHYQLFSDIANQLSYLTNYFNKQCIGSCVSNGITAL